MTFDLTILSMAKGLAAHAGQRQSLVSENIANADTRDFKARDLKPFAEVYAGADGDLGFAAKATRPGHAGFGATAGAARPMEVAKLGADSPNGNSVSIEDQMARGARAVADHELALGVLRKSMDLIRMSIGRR